MTFEPIVDPSIISGKFEDFIGTWQNFVTAEFCDEIIEEFEKKINNMVGSSDRIMDGLEQFGDKANLGRKDTSILLEDFLPKVSIKLREVFSKIKDDHTSVGKKGASFDVKDKESEVKENSGGSKVSLSGVLSGVKSVHSMINRLKGRFS